MTNIALRSLGAHPQHLHLHSMVHRHMRYHIKTANGVVNTFCQHNPPSAPFWGAGQGACDAAARCTAVSSCIFNAYESQCSPLLLQNPTKDATIFHSLLAFVDDATTAIPLSPTIDWDLATTCIRSHVSLWERLQFCAGGKLNIDKCNISVITWVQDSFG